MKKTEIKITTHDQDYKWFEVHPGDGNSSSPLTMEFDVESKRLTFSSYRGCSLTIDREQAQQLIDYLKQIL